MNYSKFLSTRITNISRAGSRETGELIANAAAKGVDCIKLSGFPPGQPGDNVIEAAERAVHNNGKADSRGLAILRNAIAEKVKREDNFSADPESEILVTNGAIFALHLIMTALIDKGDEVLIPAPSFFLTAWFILPVGVYVMFNVKKKTISAGM